MNNSDYNNLFTVAFYNIENLFDTEDNPYTLDDEFTPEGMNAWDEDKYENKLFKLGKAISNIGYSQSKKTAALVGLAEVENDQVLQDLLDSKFMKTKNFGFVHYDSPDERGIDTALLYNKDYFELLDAETKPLYVYTPEGERDYTRDILHVTGNLNGERIHVLVNHWPSRRSGDDVSEVKRIEAAHLVRSVMENVINTEADARFIIMGDFNDGPLSESIKNNLMDDSLFNPMDRIISHGGGSLVHHREWILFDQIIISRAFLDEKKGCHKYIKAEVFNERFLAERSGRYKGTPFRTFVGDRYMGGYSDHFPVYVLLEKN